MKKESSNFSNSNKEGSSCLPNNVNFILNKTIYSTNDYIPNLNAKVKFPQIINETRNSPFSKNFMNTNDTEKAPLKKAEKPKNFEISSYKNKSKLVDKGQGNILNKEQVSLISCINKSFSDNFNSISKSKREKAENKENEKSPKKIMDNNNNFSCDQHKITSNNELLLSRSKLNQTSDDFQLNNENSVVPSKFILKNGKHKIKKKLLFSYVNTQDTNQSILSNNLNKNYYKANYSSKDFINNNHQDKVIKSESFTNENKNKNRISDTFNNINNDLQFRHTVESIGKKNKHNLSTIPNQYSHRTTCENIKDLNSLNKDYLNYEETNEPSLNTDAMNLKLEDVTLDNINNIVNANDYYKTDNRENIEPCRLEKKFNCDSGRNKNELTIRNVNILFSKNSKSNNQQIQKDNPHANTLNRQTISLRKCENVNALNLKFQANSKYENINNTLNNKQLLEFMEPYQSKRLCDKGNSDIIRVSLKRLKDKIFNLKKNSFGDSTMYNEYGKLNTFKSPVRKKVRKSINKSKTLESEVSFYLPKEEPDFPNNSPCSPTGRKKFKRMKTFNTFRDIYGNRHSKTLLTSPSPYRNVLSPAKDLRMLKNKIKKDFYCPFCMHCNHISDEYLNKYFDILEGKNIIKKGFNYILNNFAVDKGNRITSSNDFMENFLSKDSAVHNIGIMPADDPLKSCFNTKLKKVDSSKDIYLTDNYSTQTNSVNNNSYYYNTNAHLTSSLYFSNSTNNFNDKSGNNHFNSKTKITKTQTTISNCLLADSKSQKGYLNNLKHIKNINNKDTTETLNSDNINHQIIPEKEPKAEIEKLLKYYQKNNLMKKNKKIYNIVTNFLDSLLMNKIAIEDIIGVDAMEKLKEKLFPQGLAFEETDGLVEFDKELDLIFEGEVKDKIKQLFKSIVFFPNKNKKEKF